MNGKVIRIPRIASLMVISFIVITHEQTNDNVEDTHPWNVITLKNTNRLVRRDKAFDSIMSLLIRNSRSNSQVR